MPKINFKATSEFSVSFKKLRKKYRSLDTDVAAVRDELSQGLKLGIDLGGGFRKIRMSITSKNKGKSGGARIIIHELVISVKETDILFVVIYDKSDTESISTDSLKQIVKDYN